MGIRFGSARYLQEEKDLTSIDDDAFLGQSSIFCCNSKTEKAGEGKSKSLS